MDPQQVASWVHQGESETQEFKRTTAEQRSAAHALCAMLNHRGGRVLFGISDDKQIIGQEVSDRTMQELVREITAIDPAPDPTIDVLEISQGRNVIVVTVPQGRNRPYSYKGTPYRRVAFSRKQ